MSTNAKNPSLVSRIKNIKMPVFQLIFYSSLGYLGYIFYQDYRYKELLQQIQSKSKTKTVNPLRKISTTVEKISEAQGKRQLRFLLKDLQTDVKNYWIDPHKNQNVIDFEMKELQKSQEDKKIWWLKPYLSRMRLLTDHFQRSTILKEGTFGLFFWTSYRVEQKNEMTEGKTIRALIQKASKLRDKKCEDFALNRKVEGFQNYDREIQDCLNETLREVASLEKMKQRIRIIEENQSLN